MNRKTKKNILLFSFILFVIILLLISAIIKRKLGYAYKIQFLQPDIPKDEILEALSAVDSIYLEGIHAIEIADMPLHYKGISYDGLYIIGGKIRINVMNGFNKEVLLHELKHHYCWKKERYLGHEGCFKEPPLIVEEPVKDEVIVPELLEENQPNCFDSIQNQDETGIDCGGSCISCEKETIEMLAPPNTQVWLLLKTGIFTLTVLSLFVVSLISTTSYYRNKPYNIYERIR